jgi:hypothetical protein
LIEITLSRDEWVYAATVGIERQIDGLLNNRTPRHNSPEQKTHEGWFWNVNGAAGEKAVSDWLGVNWDGASNDFDKDVGPFEVRTAPKHDYPLRAHDKDPDDKILILVTGVGPEWRIQGWIPAKRAKRKEWFHDRPPPVRKPTGKPAYWVEQQYLSKNLDVLRERYREALGLGEPEPAREESEGAEVRSQP